MHYICQNSTGLILKKCKWFLKMSEISAVFTRFRRRTNKKHCSLTLSVKLSIYDNLIQLKKRQLCDVLWPKMSADLNKNLNSVWINYTTKKLSKSNKLTQWPLKPVKMCRLGLKCQPWTLPVDDVNGRLFRHFVSAAATEFRLTFF